MGIYEQSDRTHQVSAKTFSIVLIALLVLSVAYIQALSDGSKLGEEIAALQVKDQEKDKQIRALTMEVKRLASECVNKAR